MHGVQGVGCSNHLAPTNRINDLRRKLYVYAALYIIGFYNIRAAFLFLDQIADTSQSRNNHPMPNDYTDQEQAFLDACNEMSDVDQERILRFTKRVANKPAGLELSPEILQYMFDNDCDIPLN